MAISTTDIDTDMSGAGGRTGNALIASDRVEGTAVRRSNGDKVGTVERLMIEKVSGRVAYAVMSFGGFLGLGEDEHTLPWSVLTYNTDLDAYEVNLTDEQLRGAPRRTGMGTTVSGPSTDPGSRNDPSLDRDWEEHVHRYYNATPYWGI